MEDPVDGQEYSELCEEVLDDTNDSFKEEYIEYQNDKNIETISEDPNYNPSNENIDQQNDENE